MSEAAFKPVNKFKNALLPLGGITAILIGWLTAEIGVAIPVVLILIALLVPFIISIFNEPRIGFISFIVYCFVMQLFIRETVNLPFGFGIEGLLGLSWIGVALHNSKQYDFSNSKKDLTLLGWLWFGISVLELLNPYGSSIFAWLMDIRYPLLWLLSIPFCMAVFNKKKDLNLFLILIIAFSVLATLNGIKQLNFGLFPGEQRFLDEGGAKTHILFGKLRVFSFYSDAGQFGASQAHIGLVALILALGPFKLWKRIVCGVAAILLLYGMLISGTRGALFALLTGVFVALVINKNLKVILIGGLLSIGSVVFLKYTYILNGNGEIRRMRSALNPEDASLNVRFENQKLLANYLSSHPFGGGLGAIGTPARLYNEGKFLTYVPPDSYWVKVWAMYGVVGLVIWFGIMMYILGKCGGIVWNLKDNALRFKLSALTAGIGGIFFCSYGNEVINTMPSAMIVYVSAAFVFLGPQLERETEQKKRIA